MLRCPAMAVGADLSWPLAHAVRQHGRSPAVSDGHRSVTYAELGERVGALGVSLDALGVSVGGRVGALAANSLAHLECFLGVPSFGRVIVDLNFRLAVEELALLAQDAELELLFTDAERLDVAR